MKKPSDQSDTKKQIVERILNGEKQVQIAKDLGCTKQYISAVFKEYKNRGDYYLERKQRGRKKFAPLTESEKKQLHHTVTTSTPKQLSLKGNTWNEKNVKQWISRSFSHSVSNEELQALFATWNIELLSAPSETSFDEEFDPDFYEYINSDVYKKIKAREEQNRLREEASSAKRGRPKKTSSKEVKEGEDDFKSNSLPNEIREMSVEELLKMKQSIAETQSQLKNTLYSSSNKKAGKFSRNQKSNFQKKKKKKRNK